jgi:hypothetical protein
VNGRRNAPTLRPARYGLNALIAVVNLRKWIERCGGATGVGERLSLAVFGI